MSVYRLLLTAALFIAGISPACADLDETESNLSAFDAELTTLRKQQLLPGLAVAIIKNQELLWSKGYGYADDDHEVPIKPDTPFWIASVTKTFVGLAFLHLEAEGLIDLNEKAADTPKFDGLCEWLAGTALPFGHDLNCESPITIRHILQHQVQGQPGERFAYNPIMYSRLSRYLEHKLGEGVDAVEGRHNFLGQTIDRTILDPAGMTRTMSSQWDRSKALAYFDMAEGFGVSDNGQLTKRPRPGRHIPGGAGVVSTVMDLARYDIAIDTGKIAPEPIRSRLFDPGKLNDGSIPVYAYGWYVQDYQGTRLLWHSGWDEEAGFSAIYLKVPEHKITLIMLANGEGLWWGNPLDGAEIHKSVFVQTFFRHFLNQQFNPE